MSPSRSALRRRSMERRAATERAILDAVESLLADRPFRDVAVEDVMALAGLTRTALYRYFPDRESVLLRLMAEVASELTEASRLWLEASDPIRAIEEAGTALALVYQRRGRLLLAFADAAASGPDVERTWRDAVGGFVALCADRIGQLREAGLSDVEDPVETARALCWMTERYLLEVFARDTVEQMTPERASNVVGRIWQRAIFPG